jgi:hypothetical protein
MSVNSSSRVGKHIAPACYLFIDENNKLRVSLSTPASPCLDTPGMPMEVSGSGTGDLNALVMFVADATKPFSSPATMP